MKMKLKMWIKWKWKSKILTKWKWKLKWIKKCKWNWKCKIKSLTKSSILSAGTVGSERPGANSSMKTEKRRIHQWRLLAKMPQWRLAMRKKSKWTEWGRAGCTRPAIPRPYFLVLRAGGHAELSFFAHENSVTVFDANGRRIHGLRQWWFWRFSAQKMYRRYWICANPSFHMRLLHWGNRRNWASQSWLRKKPIFSTSHSLVRCGAISWARGHAAGAKSILTI